MPEDELATLVAQAGGFGAAELSRAADIVAKALTDMAGATSPRLHLELMAARLLVPETGDVEVGTLARVERIEQRLDGAAPAVQQAPAAPTTAPLTDDRARRTDSGGTRCGSGSSHRSDPGRSRPSTGPPRPGRTRCSGSRRGQGVPA